MPSPQINLPPNSSRGSRASVGVPSPDGHAAGSKLGKTRRRRLYAPAEFVPPARPGVGVHDGRPPLLRRGAHLVHGPGAGGAARGPGPETATGGAARCHAHDLTRARRRGGSGRSAELSAGAWLSMHGRRGEGTHGAPLVLAAVREAVHARRSVPEGGMQHAVSHLLLLARARAGRKACGQGGMMASRLSTCGPALPAR